MLLPALTRKGYDIIDIRYCHLYLCLLLCRRILLSLSCLFMAISVGRVVVRNPEHRRVSLFPDQFCFGQAHGRTRLWVSGRGSVSIRYRSYPVTFGTGIYIT